MQQRNISLDALRGYAILTMILSGSIAYGDTLPAWMYHAQLPPPHHKFTPTIAGITWVDLVFPFFLFSMGAAIPLALNQSAKSGCNFTHVLKIAVRRLVFLAFFALFTEHMKAWVISDSPSVKEHLLSVLAFGLLFFQLYQNKNEQRKKLFLVVRILSFLIAISLLVFLRFRGNDFNFYKSDIIILVLANMSFFVTIIWWFTRNAMWIRIGILPFVAAIFFAAKEVDGGWAKAIFDFTSIGSFKFDWLYNFYFLKYLFIVIPGTIAGDYLLRYNAHSIEQEEKKVPAINFPIITILSFALVVSNTIFLFTRHLQINLIATVSLLLLLFYYIKKLVSYKHELIFNFYKVGAYLLMLGLFFESFEGGIKKDHSTYSYYFVTSGLAFIMLIGFSSFVKSTFGSVVTNYLSSNGRNPMLAYVAGSLLLMPILQITGGHILLEKMNGSAFLGLLKGVLFTGIVSLITVYCTKKRWYCKT